MGQVTLSVRIEESMQQALERMAESRRGAEGYEGTVSELVREVLQEYIDHQAMLRMARGRIGGGMPPPSPWGGLPPPEAINICTAEVAADCDGSRETCEGCEFHNAELEAELEAHPLMQVDLEHEGDCPLCTEDGCTCSIYGGTMPPVEPCFIAPNLDAGLARARARLFAQDERQRAVEMYDGESLARKVFKVVNRRIWDEIPWELLRNPFGGHVRVVSKRGRVPDVEYDFEDGERPKVGPFEIASQRAWDVWENLREHAEERIKGSINAQETIEAMSLIEASVSMQHVLYSTDIWDGSAFNVACSCLWDDGLAPYAVIFHPRKLQLVNDWRNVQKDEVEWPEGQNAGDLVLLPTEFCPVDRVYFIVAPEKLGYLIVDNGLSFLNDPAPGRLKEGIVGWERIGMCLLNGAGIVRVEQVQDYKEALG